MNQAYKVERRSFLSFSIHSQYLLLAGQRRLLPFIGQLDFGDTLNVDKLVHHAKRWLRLARDQVGPDPEQVDLVVGRLKLFQKTLVDVVAREYLQVRKVEAGGVRGRFEEQLGLPC